MRRYAGIVAGAILLAACGRAVGGSAPSTATLTPSPTLSPSPTPSPTVSPSANIPRASPTSSTSPASAGPWPRYTNLVYDSTTDQVLLFGGSASGVGTNGDTWIWEGTSWHEAHPTATPPNRDGGALADDPAHHVVVLFGGGNHDDTWLWDGRTWNQALPAHSPSVRTAAAMTYDAVHHVVVLFGGQGGGGGTLGDTWTWDGTDWAERTPASSPPARAYARLAFDAARGVTLLFGGDIFRFDDTWSWDGTSWTRLHPAHTPPAWDSATRFPQPMVYDGLRKVVMFVGPQWHTSVSTNNTMETWTWNGTDWTHQTPATSPPVRDGAGLAFDAHRGVTILAGGASMGNGDATSTWSWDGVNWTMA
jgi:hypothetical protein